ncbi:SAM pointed domain-containing Ets transcription factor-like [Alosa sapidissima]|uniref:SAM pointed domain-containing Ets transcription factor-like n=1 Tax=Alosa sapidissima TaxID=34773 RepID=UPI001C080E91|nr:SAM pointed domain-containing Ets transcription factor-like [Alosa sapidissima]
MASPRDSQAETTVCPADVTLTGSPETISVKAESGSPDITEPWSLNVSERSLQVLYLPSFDILPIDETTWLERVREPSPTPTPSPEVASASPTRCAGEPEQCPQIHSSALVVPALPVGPDEERSLEQMQTLVVEEVLKDIETACKLLNITPDPVDWKEGNVQKWLLWTEHLYKLPSVGKAFQQLDGKDLCAMSQEDFHKLCPEYSSTLHAHLDIWKSAAWMHGRCSVTERPTPAGGQDAWPEADSSCSGQPVHLWQFLRELLLKPHNYSRYIRWLNKDKGIFKIEDSAQVARLWGQRKNRPAMNYDKLSRSIRQYYKKGIIRKPDMSQRLVYQFVNQV